MCPRANAMLVKEETDIRVAVVDDHALVSDSEIEIAGEADDGLAAIKLLEKMSIDIILLDIHMPRLDGLGCLDIITERWPDKPVIVLTVDEDPEVAREVMRRGAAAFVPKFVRPADLASIVRQVASGSVIIGGPRVVDGSDESDSAGGTPAARHGLSERELEVLGLVAQGKSNAEIAHMLYVTTKTVKYHLTGIYTKLDLKNRTEAAAYAINHGLVSSTGPDGANPPGR